MAAPPKPPELERRRHPRVAIIAQTTVTMDGGAVHIFEVTDVSLSGAFLAVDEGLEALSVDQELVLDIAEVDRPENIRFSALVRRVVTREVAEVWDTRAGVGIEITHIDQVSLHRLAEIIDRRLRPPARPPRPAPRPSSTGDDDS